MFKLPCLLNTTQHPRSGHLWMRGVGSHDGSLSSSHIVDFGRIAVDFEDPRTRLNPTAPPAAGRSRKPYQSKFTEAMEERANAKPQGVYA
jgi:hypothetical protein